MTYLLSDYPVLARFAAGRTMATRLDVRACRRLYALATAADLGAMGPEERGLYDSLAASEPVPGSGGPIAALQAQVRADGSRRMADEKAFMDDLSGEPDMVPGPFRVKCLLCGDVAESWHRNFGACAGSDARRATLAGLATQKARIGLRFHPHDAAPDRGNSCSQRPGIPSERKG